MKPDLDAIRARWEKRGHSFDDKDEFERGVRTDIPALLAYIDQLERDVLDERATFESCNRARMHCERENAVLRVRQKYAVGEAEWAQRIETLEHMLAEERENVDTLRAAVEHAEQRFVDEYDARKAAERELAELKAQITTLEAMR